MGFDLGLQMNAFVMLYMMLNVSCIIISIYYIEITIRNSCFGKIPILPSIQLFFYKKIKYLYFILLFCYIYVTTYIHKLYRQPLIIWFIIENHNELNPVDFFFTGRTTGIEPARGGFTIHCLGTTWLRPPQTNWQSLSTVIPFQEWMVLSSENQLIMKRFYYLV